MTAMEALMLIAWDQTPVRREPWSLILPLRCEALDRQTPSDFSEGMGVSSSAPEMLNRNAPASTNGLCCG
jgi:hypothetical protein